MEMEDWQISVLSAPYIRADMDEFTMNRLVIRKTSKDSAMSPKYVRDFVRATKRKPIIMNSATPSYGRYADRNEVLYVLTTRVHLEDMKASEPKTTKKPAVRKSTPKKPAKPKPKVVSKAAKPDDKPAENFGALMGVGWQNVRMRR